MVIFVHIPKTAGITMNRVLARQYGNDAVWIGNWGPHMPTASSRLLGIYVGIKLRPNGTWFPELCQVAAFRFGRMPAEKQARIRAIKGHMGFGLGRYLPLPAAYFTLMRDPVERALSHYYYTADWENRPGDVSLYEHIATRIEGNLQTRMMAAPYDDSIELQPDELLAHAKRNLRTCAVVGLTERFDESVLLLRKAFGWRWPFYIRDNVNHKRPPRAAVPPETLEQLASDNALDAALYEYARELFAEQVREYGPSFERDLRKFRAWNAAWLWWRRLKGIPRRAFNALDRLVWPLFDPAYRALSKWGGLRRLVPSRFRPRMVVPQDLGESNYRLYIGKRVVGRYRAAEQTWEIHRPWRLFVDVAALPAIESNMWKKNRAESSKMDS